MWCIGATKILKHQRFMHIHPNLSLWMHPICLYFKTKLFYVSLEIHYIFFFKEEDMRFYFTLYGISSPFALLLPPRCSDCLHF